MCPGTLFAASVLALSCNVAWHLPARGEAAPIPVPAMKPSPPGSEPLPAPKQEAPVAPQPMRPSDRGTTLSLPFKPGQVELDDELRRKLAGVAAEAKSDDRRLQIKAFAAGGKSSISEVRRTSLKRALAVRSYLIDEGVRSTRIEVRALGAPLDGGPEDRVDVTLLEN